MLISHLIRDICLLLGEFFVVSHFTIFPLDLLGSAEKPMAGPSSSKGKIMKFQISGGKHNCLLLPVPISKFIHTETIAELSIYIYLTLTVLHM